MIYISLIKNSNLLFFLVLIIAMSGCVDSSINKEIHPTLIQVSDENVEKSLKMSEVVDSLQYVCLETRSDNLIGTIDKLIPFKDKLIIVDNSSAKTISLFENDGTFITQIGKRGVAPDEYAEIGSIAVDEVGNRIFILEPYSSSLLMYDMLNNIYIGRMYLDFSVSDIEYVGNDILACYSNYSYRGKQHLKGNVYKNMSPNLVLYNINTKEKKVFLPVDNSIQPQELIHLKQPMCRFNMDASLIYPLNNHIYIINSDGILKDYFVDLGDKETNKMNVYIEKLKKEDITVNQLGDGGDAQPDFYYLTESLCSDDIIYLAYVNYKQHSAGIGFYYPETNVYLGGKYPIENDIDGGFPMMPVASFENKFYTVIEPYQLKEFDTVDSQLVLLKNKINEEDNPIIMISTMKKK